MAAASWTMADPRRFARAQRADAGRAAAVAGATGRSALPPPLSAWTSARDLPEPPSRRSASGGGEQGR